MEQSTLPQAPANAEAAKKPAGDPPQPGQDDFLSALGSVNTAKGPTLLEVKSSYATADQLHTLHQLALQRQNEVALDVPWEEAKKLCERARTFMNSMGLPRSLSVALGRCL